MAFDESTASLPAGTLMLAWPAPQFPLLQYGLIGQAHVEAAPGTLPASSFADTRGTHRKRKARRGAQTPRTSPGVLACSWYILCTHPRTASQATVPAPTSAPLPSISIGFKCVMSLRLDGSATGNLGLSGAPSPATGGKIRFLPASGGASSTRGRNSSGTRGMTSDGDDT